MLTRPLPGSGPAEDPQSTLSVTPRRDADEHHRRSCFDSRAGQFASAFRRLDQCPRLPGRMLDEGGGGGGLGAVELVVEGRAADGQGLAEGDERRAYERERLRNDPDHHDDQGREMQSPVLLDLTRLLEDGVDLGRREGVLQTDADSESHRRVRLVAVKNLLGEGRERTDG